MALNNSLPSIQTRISYKSLETKSELKHKGYWTSSDGTDFKVTVSKLFWVLVA